MDTIVNLLTCGGIVAFAVIIAAVIRTRHSSPNASNFKDAFK